MPPRAPSAAGHHSFCNALDPEALAALGRLGSQRRYRRGETVLLEGDRTSSVLVLREGRAKVVVTSIDGHETVLAVRGPGELVGELAALLTDKQPRVASVVALEPVIASVLRAEEFREFLRDHASATFALLEMLVHRLSDADRRRVEFGSLDTIHRLARLLVELAATHGSSASAERTVDLGLHLSQDELARMIGASRESVARSLTKLRSLGLISTGRRTIEVLDVEALRQYAG